MTHASLASGLLPTGSRSVALRLSPARYIGDRKSGSMERDVNSVFVVRTCRNMRARPVDEVHPRNN